MTHGINGHIRNTIRYEQFQHACNCLNIVCLTGSPMTDTDGYIAGFFPTGVFENRPFRMSRNKINLDQSNPVSDSITDAILKRSVVASSCVESRVTTMLCGFSCDQWP
jgi:hypothetical protein